MGAEVREIGDVVADSRRLGSPRGRKSGSESICNHPRRRHALGSLTLTTRPVAICLSGSWCALVYPFPATSVIQYVPSPGDVRPPHLRRPLLFCRTLADGIIHSSRADFSSTASGVGISCSSSFRPSFVLAFLRVYTQRRTRTRSLTHLGNRDVQGGPKKWVTDS